MKAVVYTRYGKHDVLLITTLERPVPKNNEVLIRVKAAGLDYGQWHLMTGKPYALRFATGLTKPKQCVLGRDVSGVMEAVGAKVTRVKVGDAVFGAASGTFAELTCAREDQLCPRPERLSFEQSAAATVSGVTALIGLRDVAKVKPGQADRGRNAHAGVWMCPVRTARKEEVTRASGAKTSLNHNVQKNEPNAAGINTAPDLRLPVRRSCR